MERMSLIRIMRKYVILTIICVFFGLSINCYAQGKVTRHREHTSNTNTNDRSKSNNSDNGASKSKGGNISGKGQPTITKTAQQLTLEGDSLFELKDYPAAAELFKQAADMDYAEAQYKLGMMYQKGLGFEINNTEAVRWYRMAADQNYAKALNGLGIMYECGLGVDKDYKEAT